VVAEKVARVGAYEEAYGRSIEGPEGFWGEAAGLIDSVPPTRARPGRLPRTLLPVVRGR
jgi:hypothetical protein